MDAQPVETTRPIIPPRRRWWRDLFLGLMLFSCGFLVGGVVVARVYTHRLTAIQQRGFDKDRAFERLRRKLGLRDDQAKKVQAVLGQGMDELSEVRHAVRPKINDTLQRMRTDVSNLLDEKQKVVWESRFESIRERWFPSLPDETKRDGAPETKP